MRPLLATLFSLLVLSLATPSLAVIPLRTPLQGVVRDNAGVPVAEDVFQVTFALYASVDGADPVWSESWPADGGDCGVDPAGCVHVQGGIFRIELGAHSPLSPEVFAVGTLWLGMSVEGEPELPRRPLGTSPYAFHAGVAADLECTACVGDEDLDPAVRQGIVDEAVAAVAQEGYAKADEVLSIVGEDDLAPGLAQGIVDDAVAAVAQEGYAKVDEVLTTEDDLPAGGLNEISNGTLSNESLHVFSVLEAVAIEDDFPPGVTSEILVPDVGTARNLRISLDLSNSDISTLTITLTDPAGAVFVLWAGGEEGVQLVATYPAPQVPADGDLTAWHGQNPAGSWVLHVVDDGFLDDNLDGQINSWSVELEILSSSEITATADISVHGDLDVAGDLAVGGTISGPGGLQVNGRVQIGEAAAECDASLAGSIHYDPGTQRLVFCDGDSLLQLKACDTACQLAEETQCGQGITNGCGDPCPGTGTAIDATQCLLLASSTPCQTTVVDTCGNDCANEGTDLDQALCPAVSEVACGSLVVDPCGNACGELGTQCPVGQICKGATCAPPASCAEVLETNPNAPDGQYAIDSDGPGGVDSYDVTCDMTTDAGGWMLVDIDYLRLHAPLTTETDCGSGDEHGFVDNNSKFYGYPNCHDYEVFNDFDIRVDYTEIRGEIDFYPSSGSVGGWTTSGAHPDNDNYGDYASDSIYVLDAGGNLNNRSWHRWGKPGQVFHVAGGLGWAGEWQSEKHLGFATINTLGGSVIRFSTFSESGAPGSERWAFSPKVYVR